MASFSSERPWAYHVIPLHLMRRLLATGAILSKNALGEHQTRRTTTDVDRLLGFASFVHLYLPKLGAAPSSLPIVGAQLAPSTTAPFPHVVLRLDTRKLDDADVGVCNWNIAVSAPKTKGGHRGGNWTRGTNPTTIAANWDKLRAEKPDVERARGFFHEGIKVPLLLGPQIASNLGLIRKQRNPELLVKNEVPLALFDKVITFSKHDRKSLSQLADLTTPIEEATFDGYTGADDAAVSLRDAIDAHLRGAATAPALDFDARRPKSTTT